MTRIATYLTAVALLVVATACTGDSTRERIRQSVERQMERYPHSTLRDLYKNYFQDRFGPGHIIADEKAADNYLRYELENSATMEGDDYEPTGYEERFMRVNLSVIADGRVPYDKYLSAFVRSVNGIEPITVEQWREEWKVIDEVINEMNLNLPDYEADRAEIWALLERGEYVMHHSKLFEQHYDPHYRIIEREIFQREILPLIEQKR
ncbi:MAG: hypothetical protein IJ976_00545 [Alistipes sp.]|nr:hypothetical protein [Alistipes sp.]MBR3774817.1 hypothetical protein [Alistipes sp.]